MEDKIKIMFYTPSLNVGGIERVFVTYANSLCQICDVYFVFGHNGGDLISLLHEKVIACSLGSVRLRSSLPAFIRIINQYKPNYLISGGEIPNLFCLIASFFSKTKPKNIFSQHNYFNVESNRFICKFIIKSFYNLANKVISVSNGISSFLLDLGVDKNLLVTLYNPIDVDDIVDKSHFPLVIPQKEYLLFVGRLNKVKNLLFMIESFKLVLEKYPELTLLLVGDGDMKHLLDNYIQQNGLINKVVLVGSVPNPYPYIAKSKLLLLPSFSEALPTVILEAFSLGITVVATPTNGANDLLKNGTLGYISSSFDNPSEFSNLIFKALENPMPISILKKNAELYSINNKIRELLSCLYN